MTEEEELADVIAISRFSQHKDDDDVVKVTKRNEQYIQFYQKLHRESHAGCKCEPRTFSVVINGVSSNQDFSNLNQLKSAFKYIEQNTKSIGRRKIVLFCSQADGFTTNAPGLQTISERFQHYNMNLFIFDHAASYHEYRLSDISMSITSPLDTELPAFNLVQTVGGVSVGKERIAHAKRKIAQLVAGKRNSTAIPDLDDDHEEEEKATGTDVQPVPRVYTTATVLDRRQAGWKSCPTATKPQYNLPLDLITNKFECIVESCSETFDTMDEMTKHAATEIFKEKDSHLCPLCDSDRDHIFPNPSTLAVHLPRHFEPTIECEEDDCEHKTTTQQAIKKHVKGTHKHEVKLTTWKCPEPDCDFSTTSRGRKFDHIKQHEDESVVCDCGVEVKSSNIHDHQVNTCKLRDQAAKSHQCPHCSSTFSMLSILSRHIHCAHTRRDQILGFAERAGLMDEDEESEYGRDPKRQRS